MSLFYDSVMWYFIIFVNPSLVPFLCFVVCEVWNQLHPDTFVQHRIICSSLADMAWIEVGDLNITIIWLSDSHTQ